MTFGTGINATGSAEGAALSLGVAAKKGPVMFTGNYADFTLWQQQPQIPRHQLR